MGLNLDILGLNSDIRASTPEEIETLKQRILKEAPHSFNMQDIYNWNDVPDLTLYVALHQLIVEEKLEGHSIYDLDFKNKGRHSNYLYKKIRKDCPKEHCSARTHYLGHPHLS